MIPSGPVRPEEAEEDDVYDKVVALRTWRVACSADTAASVAGLASAGHPVYQGYVVSLRPATRPDDKHLSQQHASRLQAAFQAGSEASSTCTGLPAGFSIRGTGWLDGMLLLQSSIGVARLDLDILAGGSSHVQPCAADLAAVLRLHAPLQVLCLRATSADAVTVLGAVAMSCHQISALELRCQWQERSCAQHIHELLTCIASMPQLCSLLLTLQIPEPFHQLFSTTLAQLVQQQLPCLLDLRLIQVPEFCVPSSLSMVAAALRQRTNPLRLLDIPLTKLGLQHAFSHPTQAPVLLPLLGFGSSIPVPSRLFTVLHTLGCLARLRSISLVCVSASRIGKEFSDRLSAALHLQRLVILRPALSSYQPEHAFAGLASHGSDNSDDGDDGDVNDVIGADEDLPGDDDDNVDDNVDDDDNDGDDDGDARTDREPDLCTLMRAIVRVAAAFPRMQHCSPLSASVHQWYAQVEPAVCRQLIRHVLPAWPRLHSLDAQYWEVDASDVADFVQALKPMQHLRDLTPCRMDARQTLSLLTNVLPTLSSLTSLDLPPLHADEHLHALCRALPLLRQLRSLGLFIRTSTGASRRALCLAMENHGALQYAYINAKSVCVTWPLLLAHCARSVCSSREDSAPTGALFQHPSSTAEADDAHVAAAAGVASLLDLTATIILNQDIDVPSGSVPPRLNPHELRTRLIPCASCGVWRSVGACIPCVQFVALHKGRACVDAARCIACFLRRPRLPCLSDPHAA